MGFISINGDRAASSKSRMVAAGAFTPRSISGLALWLDASSADTLYTTDAGPVTAVASPLDIAGCVGWWDASDASTLFAADTGSTLATTTVGRWANKVSGGSDKDLLQTDSTKRPTITSNYIGGMQSLVFDGTNDALLRSFTLDATCHLFVVMKWPASYSANVRATDGYAQNTMSIVRTSNTAFTVYGSASLSLTGSGNALSPQIVEVCKNGTSSRLCINGAGQSFGNLSAEAPNGLTIGAYGLGTAAFDNVGFAEVIAFSDPLSVADAARVSAYLATKWGISGVHVPATATSDPVGAWLDKSGNARHATQSTAGSRPRIQSSLINNRRVVEFPNNAQNLQNHLNMTGALTTTNNIEMIVVARKIGAFGGSAGYGSLLRSSISNAAGPWLAVDLGRVVMYGGTQGSQLAASAVPSSAFIAHGSMISGSTELRINGALVDSDSLVGTPAIAATSTLIGPYYNSGGGPLFADVAEVLAYNKVLSAAERRRLEGYLASKWGITLAPQVSNADAQDWVNRVYANGGTVSTSTAAAVNTFCDSLGAASLRDRFYRLNLFCGSNLNAALVPLYRGPSLGGTQYGNATDTNNAFVGVGTDYAETGASGGLLCNGSTKYLTLGTMAQLKPSWTTNHFGLDVKDGFPDATTRYQMGAYFNETRVDSRGWYAMVGSGSSFKGFDSGSTSRYGITANANMKMAVRSSSSNLSIYEDGTQVATTQTSPDSATVLPGGQFCVGAVSYQNVSSGTPTTIVNGYAPAVGTMRGYSIGESMDSTQRAAFASAWSAFRTAMGRI